MGTELIAIFREICEYKVKGKDIPVTGREGP
jgi:hypothetical protein